MSIEVANESGVVVDEPALVAVARHALDRLGVSPLAELSLLLVDVVQMEGLHLRWMGEPGPTDVLAFPMDELRPGLVNEEPEEGVLGDLVLCPDVAERQATTAGHERDAEIELLTVHGILHLLGYDHAEADEHREMFGLQDELLGHWRASQADPAADPATEPAPGLDES